jgi:hypothetical protein
MLSGELACLFTEPSLDSATLAAKSPNGTAKAHLEAFLSHIDGLSDLTSPEDVKDALMPYADAIPKEEGGRGAALWPLRYALSGQERSPDPFTLIHILGAEESKKRIRVALTQLA